MKSFTVFLLIFYSCLTSILAQTKKPGAPFSHSAYASDITSSSATLNSSVSPNGDNSLAQFIIEIGNVKQESGYEDIGNGFPWVELKPYKVSGLSPETTYRFKVESKNNIGNSVSSWVRFTTTKSIEINNSRLPKINDKFTPTINNTYASEITSNSAIFQGVVNPNGDSTYASFLTPNSGALDQHFIGSGSEPIRVRDYLFSNLTPESEYQFKIVATNKNGTIIGEWVQFKTLLKEDYKGISVVTINSELINSISEKNHKLRKKGRSILKRLDNKSNKTHSNIKDISVDIENIYLMNDQLNNIDQINYDLDLEEVKSINEINEYFNKSLKLLNKCRKLKRISNFGLKFNSLIKNVNLLSTYFTNRSSGYFINKASSCFNCTLLSVPFYYLNLGNTNTNNNLFKIEEKIPVCVQAVKVNDDNTLTQMVGLRVNYRRSFYEDDDEKHIWPFRSLTSNIGSCEGIIPGEYNFWLTNDSQNRMMSSYLRYIEIGNNSKGKPYPIQIPLLNK